MLNRWHFSSNGWQQLPEWGRAYGELGTLFSDSGGHKRLVIGLVPPTRAYAAAFTALGFMLEQARHPTAQPTLEAHFLRLCELAPGSAVKYQDTTDGKLRDALFEGCEEKGGKLYIGIRKNKRRVDWLPSGYAYNVQLSSKVITQLSKTQRGQAVAEGGEFLGTCVEGVDVADYRLHSRLECVFIGHKDVLTRELTRTPFAVKSETFCRGTLQDVMRVRELLAEGDSYRARLLSDRGRPTEVLETPKLVLFDSALGFLRWRDLWRDAHWLVVLDPAQNSFDEAVAALNRERRDHGCTDAPPDLPPLPEHLHTLVYEEARG